MGAVALRVLGIYGSLENARKCSPLPNNVSVLFESHVFPQNCLWIMGLFGSLLVRVRWCCCAGLGQPGTRSVAP
jgi:hypothetical protein